MNEIFLDGHATTPIDRRVAEVGAEFLTRLEFGNPSSPSFSGRKARKFLEEATDSIRKALGAAEYEVIFTSGATESNLLALGVARHESLDAIVTAPIEHESILAPIEALESRGRTVTRLNVHGNGLINTQEIEEKIGSDRAVISVAAVNHELGTIQRVSELGQIAHRTGSILHVDATQAVGRIAFDTHEIGPALVSISAHKFHGPTGIGALLVRKDCLGLLERQRGDGGQFYGIRPGTENVLGAVMMGKACEIAAAEVEATMGHIGTLRNLLQERLCKSVNCVPNAVDGPRIPGSLSITLPHPVESDLLILRNPTIAFSRASACETGSPRASKVLTAIGMSGDEAARTLRFCLTKFTTKAEIDTAAATLIDDIRSVIGGLVGS